MSSFLPEPIVDSPEESAPPGDRSDPVHHLAPVRSALPLSLPAPATSLIGREPEARAIAEMVGTSARFLTLLGPGGVGKTRLAIRAAELLADRFSDGVVFASLAEVGDADLVLREIGRVLGLREVASRSPDDAVRAFFARRQALLVLDNLEHLVEAGPALSDLLSQSPGLRILTTSRRPIEVYGEQVVRVEPLATPDRDTSDAALCDCAAVQLFIDRARAANAQFQPDAGALRFVAEIVSRLDGLPLAIELAAARIGEMPPEVLLERLATRLPVLVGRMRDMPGRLQTMRNAIEWSYGLLGPDEQAIWRKLAVFTGDFGLGAAAAVAGISDPREMEELLWRLVDASVLRRADWANGEPHFAWLETIREFGLEQLAAVGEEGQAFARHAEWFVEFAEEARSHLHGPEQRMWLDRLEREHGNLRAAMTWSLEQRPHMALRLGAALWLFWNKRGHQSEGRDWLTHALSKAEEVPSALRAEALMALGSTIAMQGELALATAHFNDALTIWRDLGFEAGEARALTLLGNAAAQSGDFALAAAHHSQARLKHLGTDQAPWEGLSTVFLGFATAMLGDTHGGLALMQEGLSLLNEIGETWAYAVALGIHGDVLASQGNAIEAARRYTESLARLTSDGEPWTAIWPIIGLATIAQSMGDNTFAARLIGVTDARVEANGGMLEPTAAVRFAETVTGLEGSMTAAELTQQRAAGALLDADGVVTEARRFVVALGEGPISSRNAAPETAHRVTGCASLTPREREVLDLVAEGLSDKAIADRLFLSPRTVANHMNHILGKLEVGTRAAAVALAIRGKQI